MKSSFLALLCMPLVCSSVSCTNEVPPNSQQVQGSVRDAKADPTSEMQSLDETTLVKAGYYEGGHPEESAVADFLRKTTAAVWLSWHNGISVENASGEGWTTT